MVGGGGVDGTRDRAETDTEGPGGERKKGWSGGGSIYEPGQHTGEFSKGEWC